MNVTKIAAEQNPTIPGWKNMLVDYANSLGVDLTDLTLSMRGGVARASIVARPQADGYPAYLSNVPRTSKYPAAPSVKLHSVEACVTWCVGQIDKVASSMRAYDHNMEVVATINGHPVHRHSLATLRGTLSVESAERSLQIALDRVMTSGMGESKKPMEMGNPYNALWLLQYNLSSWRPEEMYEAMHRRDLAQILRDRGLKAYVEALARLAGHTYVGSQNSSNPTSNLLGAAESVAMRKIADRLLGLEGLGCPVLIGHGEQKVEVLDEEACAGASPEAPIRCGAFTR